MRDSEGAGDGGGVVIRGFVIFDKLLLLNDRNIVCPTRVGRMSVSSSAARQKVVQCKSVAEYREALRLDVNALLAIYGSVS